MAGDERAEGDQRDGDDPSEEPKGTEPSSAEGPPRSFTAWWDAEIRPHVARVRTAPRPVRLGLYGAGVGLVALVIWSLLLRSDPEAKPDDEATQVVSSFLFAQRDGDCERLIGLTSEESWSDGGGLSREEFLEQCAEALDGYQLDIAALSVDVEIRSGSDEALVAISGRSDTVADAGRNDGELGRLVREDGEWKVDLDGAVLRIGRSVDETLQGYLDAYNDGDCEQMIAYLSDSAWSASGSVTQEEFMEACTKAADLRPMPVAAQLVPAGQLDVTFDGDRASSGVDLGSVLVTIGGPADVENDGRATATFVQQGLQWHLEAGDELPTGAPARPPFQALRYLELQTRLVDASDAALSVNHACVNYSDTLSEPDDSHPEVERYGIDIEVRIWREFHSSECPDLTIYQFADSDDASSAAELMADEVLEDSPTGRAGDVPGLPEAFGVGTNCDPTGCTQMVALLTQGNHLVKLRSGYAGRDDLDDWLELAGQALETQSERL